MKMRPLTLGRELASACALITSVLFFAYPHSSRADLVDGLTAYYDFDNNLIDQAHGETGSASMTQDDLTFAGGHSGTFGAGLFGGGGYLGSGPGTGHAEAFSSNDNNGTGDNITVAWWGRVDGGFTATWQAGVAKGEGNNWRFHRNGDTQTMAWQGGGGDISAAAGFEVNDGEWHYFVGTKDDLNGRVLYIDGVNVATGDPGTPMDVNDGLPFMVGENPGATNRGWLGDIDDVAVWNRPLSGDEVQEIYDAGVNDSKSLGILISEQGVDTDEDGMPDAWEIPNLGAGAELDDGSVNVDFGPAGDPDMDGSSNFNEFQRRTDPMDDDTDDDLLLDGVETNTGAWDDVTETGTDPRNPDSDGDGLLDGIENPDLPYVDENQPGSDPNLADTDSDTYPDNVEVAAGTDPANPLDFPGATGLPLVDNFETGALDAIQWLTDVNIISGGAAVVQENGHVRLTGRGHLLTRDEYDPEVEGGLYIKGKWTYTGGDDFLQILTRSDGLPDPANCCGETQNGIEFYANQTNNGVGIRVRGFEFTLTGNQGLGDIRLNAGATYEFYIIDDGAGNLGFCIWEEGNRANAAGVQDTLSFAAATSNHVVFHNREGGRTSRLEEVEIGVLADTDMDGMPDFWEMDNMLTDAAGDEDNDGLSNLEEYNLCLDPNDEDTDGDGLLDGVETLTGIFVSPMDTGTDPLDPDADDDMLLDGVETNTRILVDAMDTGSDPYDPDTDDDGMDDGLEIRVGRNPNDPSDAPAGLGVGLVNYWCFDDESLADVAHTQVLGESTVDDTGMFAGANGTAGIAFGPGLFDGGISQDGAAGAAQNNGFVEIARSADTLFGANVSNPGFPNTVTTSVWVKISGDDQDWQTVLSHGEGTQYRIAMRGGTNVPGYAGGVGEGPDNGPDIGDGGWHHIVAISDGLLASTTLYVDGVITSTAGAPVIDDAKTGSALNLNIGANPDTGAQNREWFGEIDDVAQWNRALSDAEVAEIYAAGIAGDSLKLMLGGGSVSEFRITSFTYNAETDEFTLTWPSREGEFYIIRVSPDMSAWVFDLDDGYPADAGDFTTYTFPRSLLGDNVTRFFLRIEQQ